MLKLTYLALAIMLFSASFAYAQDSAQYQQAYDYYIRQIRSKPSDLVLHRDLMDSYKEKGLLSIPVKIYKEAIEKNPGNAIIFYLVGYSYIMADQKPLEVAEESLKAALVAEPNFPDAVAALGDYYLKIGNTDMALAKWQEALEMDEKSEPARLSLARFYRSRKRYDQATQEYERLINLKPKGIAKIYLEFGNMYLEMNELDKAEVAFTNARQSDSKLAMAYYKLGQVYAKKGLRDKAIDSYQRGRRHDPNNAEVAYELAVIFLETNDIKYALLSLERGLTAETSDNQLSKDLISRIERNINSAAEFISDLADSKYTDNFHLHYFLGKFYLKQDNKDRAIKHLKVAADVSPSNPDVHYQLGLLQEETDPETARESYQKAVNLGSSEADLLFKMAQTYLEEGNETKFIETAKRALDMESNRADVHFQLAQIFKTRANIYKNSGNKLEEDKALEEAVKHFEQGLEIQSDAQKWFELGNLYERQNKIKAIRAYEKAIQLDPNFALAYYRMGNFRLNYKVGKASVLMYNPSVSVEDFKKAIELDPKLADAHFGLGEAYHQMDMPELATAEFEKTVELDPNNVKAHIYLAQDYAAAGDAQKVIYHLTKAAELDDSNPNVLRDLASMQLQFGGDAGIEPARKALEKAYKLKPEDPDILNNYGYTLYMDKMFNQSIDILKRALEIQPDYLQANYNLALAYNGIRDYDMALKYWEKVIELAPQSDLAARSLEFVEKIKKAKPKF